MKRKITVKYTGGLNMILENKLIDFFASLGFENTASGMLLKEQIRDLAFENENEKEEE